MEILSNDGSEIYMVPAGMFVDHSKISNYTFHELMIMFMRWNMVLIGYRRKNKDGTYDNPVLNPKIDNVKAPLGIHVNDYLIVIAEGPET